MVNAELTLTRPERWRTAWCRRRSMSATRTSRSNNRIWNTWVVTQLSGVFSSSRTNGNAADSFSSQCPASPVHDPQEHLARCRVALKSRTSHGFFIELWLKCYVGTTARSTFDGAPDIIAITPHLWVQAQHVSTDGDGTAIELPAFLSDIVTDGRRTEHC